MKKYYYYKKDTGEIKMIADSKITAPGFNYVQKEFTKEEEDKINKTNYLTTIKNGKLKVQKINDTKEEKLEKIDKAKDINELKEIIKQII